MRCGVKWRMDMSREWIALPRFLVMERWRLNVDGVAVADAGVVLGFP